MRWHFLTKLERGKLLEDSSNITQALPLPML